MLSVRRDSKREKLLQYAERIWNIKSGTEEERIEAAIQKTREFFERMGMKTRLSEYQIGTDAIAGLINKLELHHMVTLGEHRDVDLQVSRKVLEASI